MVRKEQIHTAVLLEEGNCSRDQDSLEEPLLQDISLNDDETATKEEDVVSQKAKTLNRQFCMIGAFLGFLIQALSLGAKAIILIRWGGGFVNSGDDEKEYGLHVLLTVLEKCTYIQYPLVFLSVFGSLSTQGVEYVQTRWFQRDIRGISESTARMTFVMAVNFLCGLLIGSFVVWGIVDVVVGYPCMMIPTFGALGICLALCYAMVRFYDSSQEDEEEAN
jgi:F0F1-type ATP synthase assembly protein I